MKTFKKYLNEASGFASGPVGENPNNLAGEVTDTLGPDLFSTPNLRRINAIIGAIGNMEYLIPEHAVEKLRNSLLKINVTFAETPAMEGKSGEFELPVTLFGGRYGKTGIEKPGEVVNDDGISHMVEGGLALKLKYEMMPNNNSCRIFAKIE